jgi:hypothetical protein
LENNSLRSAKTSDSERKGAVENPVVGRAPVLQAGPPRASDVQVRHNLPLADSRVNLGADTGHLIYLRRSMGASSSLFAEPYLLVAPDCVATRDLRAYLTLCRFDEGGYPACVADKGRIAPYSRAHDGRANKKAKAVPRTVACNTRGEVKAMTATIKDTHPTSATTPTFSIKIRVVAMGTKNER